MSPCRRATTAEGVCAGASTPYQVDASYPGTPDSAIVGRSGKACERRALVTATGASFPGFTCGIAAGMVAKYSWTCPDRTSTIAGPAPLYGTCTISARARMRKSSPARCEELPTPAEAKLNAPGFAFASAMTSFTVRARVEGWTTRILGVEATRLTGAKSATGSNGNSLNRLTLIALGATLPIRIV